MKSTRRYSLFRRKRNTRGKWERLSELALPLENARHVFQTQLLNYAMNNFEYEARLMPVPREMTLEEQVDTLIERCKELETQKQLAEMTQFE